MAICGFSWNNVAHMGITLLSGFLGTLLFFFGLRSFLGLLAGRAGREKKLHTFTFRQLQENVIHRHLFFYHKVLSPFVGRKYS